MEKQIHCGNGRQEIRGSSRGGWTRGMKRWMVAEGARVAVKGCPCVQTEEQRKEKDVREWS